MQTSIDLCNQLFHHSLTFRLVNTMPPTDFNDGWFDLVEGFSVASHLSRHCGLKWIDEYYRILKPGGLLALTVRKEIHFDIISECQRSIESLDGCQKAMAEVYTQGCTAERNIFNAVGFDYKLYKGGIEGNEESTYGEAVVSSEFIKKYWCRNFDFISYTDSPEMDQALVVLKKSVQTNNNSCVDGIRQEQYDLLKQMDLMNEVTFEAATGFNSGSRL